MKMVIEIPEETFKYYVTLANKGEQIGNLERIVLNGTLLPEHHGRLIDADKVLDDITKKNPAFVSENEKRKRYARLVYYWAVKNAPTIIEGSENEWVEKKPQKDTETYICDPEKNTECKKTHCQTLCFKTTEPRYRKTDEEGSDSK